MDGDGLMALLVGGIISLAGVVIGGGLQFFSAYRLARLQQEKERRALHIIKLEELFGLSHQIENQLTATYLKCLMHLQGHPFGRENAHDRIDDPPLLRAEMIVRMYFPRMISTMDEIISIRDNAGDGVAKSISLESIRNLNGVEIKQTKELLSRSMRQLHTTVERLKEQILDAGRLMNV